jgi:hypothetical protein
MGFLKIISTPTHHAICHIIANVSVTTAHQPSAVVKRCDASSQRGFVSGRRRGDEGDWTRNGWSSWVCDSAGCESFRRFPEYGKARASRQGAAIVMDGCGRRRPDFILFLT